LLLSWSCEGDRGKEVVVAGVVSGGKVFHQESSLIKANVEPNTYLTDIIPFSVSFTSVFPDAMMP
jgi:hypothetical protein